MNLSSKLFWMGLMFASSVCLAGARLERSVLPRSSTITASIALGDAAADFERRLTNALEQGEIDIDQWWLERFFYLFAPERVDRRFVWGSIGKVKDATVLAIEYRSIREVLRPATARAIDAMITLPVGIFTYDTAHFRFSYNLVGANAVPLEDADSSGVPDYVEAAGEYAEYSWWREVEDLGFVAPVLDPRNGERMSVGFRDMGVYGMTLCPNPCSILIENDFVGFSDNDDPEGPVAGAAKVTIAHELKHAIQWETTYMTELGWIELDATWVEDIVYPEVNDYANYINSSGSQVVNPTVPLNAGGWGSYDDAIWEISMSERYGVEFLVEFWEYRARHKSEWALDSYDEFLRQAGSSLEVQFLYDYMVRNYFTGDRALGAPSITYPDAAKFVTSPAETVSLPGELEGTLQQLSSQFLEVVSDGSSGMPEIELECPDDAKVGMVLVAWPRAGQVTLLPVENDHGNALVQLDQPWSSLRKIGVLVGNGGTLRKTAEFRVEVGSR